MPSTNENQDISLVGQCLSGSEPAWAEFYSRFQRLVRMVVRRRLHFSPEETEDVVHEVFISLMSALKTYDSSNPLQNFVGTITERVCVDKYRFSKAAKRDADTEPFDDQNPRIADCIMGGPKMGHQEAELILSEQTEILRLAFRLLGARCRQLLRLRYHEELPYSRIAKILGATENTLTVQAGRCIRELRAGYQKLLNKGT